MSGRNESQDMLQLSPARLGRTHRPPQNLSSSFTFGTHRRLLQSPFGTRSPGGGGGGGGGVGNRSFNGQLVSHVVACPFLF